MSNLINATPIEITYLDGRKETITLGQLALRQLYVFIKHLGGSDTPALAALCAGKPVEWIDTLTDDSFDALVALSIKLNFQRATDRVKADPVALGKLAPMLLDLEKVAAGIEARAQAPFLQAKPTPGQPGPAESPAPAPSASAAATGIAAST